MSSYSLRVKKQQYYSLLNSINTTLIYLNNGYNAMRDCNSINSYYVVNDVTADHNKIGSVAADANQIIMTLRNQVIPWIENKIRLLNNQIQEAEIREASER